MTAVPLPNDRRRVPLHVAIIIDGNGRWAAARGLPRTAGHRRGGEAVKIAAESAIRLGVRYLTLFGFSSENWRRPDGEINDLMGLLRYYLQSEVGFLQEHAIRLRVIGNRGKLGPELVKSIEKAEQKTKDNQRLTLTIALSYGARTEICEAGGRRQPPRSAADRRVVVRQIPLYQRHAGSGRGNQDQRREAHQQFFVVAGGVCRVDLSRYLVAGLFQAGFRAGGQ